MEATAPTWRHDGTKQTEGEVLALLSSLVRCTKPEVCVETGTFAGHGTVAIDLALQANDFGRLYTVENDFDLYRQYKGEQTKRTEFLHGDSLEFARNFDQTINFAFVDCGLPEHRIEVAFALAPKIDGLLTMHDTLYYPQMLTDAIDLFGNPSLHLKTLHGFSIWEMR